MKTEQKTSPVGTEARQPHFSWWIDARERGLWQSSWQVMVGSSEERLKKGEADLWDSGEVSSGEQTWIAYKGKPLEPARKYYWKVRIRDKNGKLSPWSRITTFTTGLPGQENWDGTQWIAYEVLPDSMKVLPGVHGSGNKLGDKARERAVIPYFRKAFTPEKEVKEAFVFVSGLGQYELYLNGEKVGDDFLAPGWTSYAERCLYNAYEVTGNLQQGENVIGAMVGTGFFYINRERYRKLVRAVGYPMLRAKMVVHYTDGSCEEITTDESWKTAPSPVIYTSIYGGESYDAGREQEGWNRPGFDDAAWKKAVPARGPGGEMRAQAEYPLKVMDTFEVKTVTAPEPGKYVYDFGQNASGIVRLKVQGRKGDTVRIRPAELLDENGLPTQKASGGPYYFEYILKGEEPEEWVPRFTYYGFRYALVEGAVPVGQGNDGRTEDTASADTAINSGNAESARILSLQMLHTRNSAPSAGSFECSNPLFNRIYSLINWAIRSNLASVTTDCPHREKLGWLEQTHLIGESIRYNYDVLHLYNKIVDDMIEAQLPDGLVPDIAPEYVVFDEGFRDSPEWGSASVIIPWNLYQWYGDKQALVKAYDMMRRYVAYLGTKADGHILSHGLGDWYDLGPEHPGFSQLTPAGLTATAIYYHDADLLSRIADVLGETADANQYAALARKIKSAFNKEFFDPATKVYATGSQTAFAMPLVTGLVEEADREAVFQNLVDSIQANDKALTAGDVGYRYLVKALQEGGASQLLYEMNNRDDVPGYGYQIRRGATALTESWPALKLVSNNHMMLGHLMEWLYGGLAGIRQQEKDKGAGTFRIEPEPVGDINWVRASYQTLAGEIKVHWEKDGKSFSLKVNIPANTRAEVVLPAQDAARVTESGRSLEAHNEVRVTGQEAGKLILSVPSGKYEFVCDGSL